MVFSLAGGAKAKLGTSARILLGEVSQGDTRSVIASADFGVFESARSSYQCETSLWLPAGRYTWQLEIVGDTAEEANILGEATHTPAQRQFITRGVRHLETVVNNDGERKATVMARIPRVTLTPSDTIEAYLKLFEFPESSPAAIGTEIFATPISQTNSDFTGDLDTLVHPYFPRPGFRYRATFTVNTNLSPPPACEIQNNLD